MNSREKGKRGERELARKLREYGYACRRGQQYCGANGDADVLGLPGVHIECKRVEKLNLYDAMAQAVSDKKENEYPVVMHRKNNHKWLATMKLTDWVILKIDWEAEIDRGMSTLCAVGRKVNLYDELISLTAGADGDIPTIEHGKREDPLVTTWLDDWIEIYKEWELNNDRDE